MTSFNDKMVEGATLSFYPLPDGRTQVKATYDATDGTQWTEVIGVLPAEGGSRAGPVANRAQRRAAVRAARATAAAIRKAKGRAR